MDITLRNKEVCGNIFQRKERLALRLEGVQRSLALNTAKNLLKLESKLRKEMNKSLSQEKMIWMQKCRINWLRFGDKNKFFHTSTIIRRRNKIETLQDDAGQWITD